MTAIDWPAGATELSDWADVGHLGEFRSFDGPIWTIPEVVQDHRGGTPARVFVSGTQLRDGTVEERCIRLEGVAWEDELSSDTARELGQALLAAAAALDELCNPKACVRLRLANCSPRPVIDSRWRAEFMPKNVQSVRLRMIICCHKVDA